MRFSSPKMHQIQHFPGLRPGPRWGSSQAHSAPPDLLAGGEGARCPLTKNPLPRSRPFGPRTQHTHILLRGAVSQMMRGQAPQIFFPRTVPGKWDAAEHRALNK